MALRSPEKALSAMLSMNKMSELSPQAAQEGIRSLSMWSPGVDIPCQPEPNVPQEGPEDTPSPKAIRRGTSITKKSRHNCSHRSGLRVEAIPALDLLIAVGKAEAHELLPGYAWWIWEVASWAPPAPGGEGGAAPGRVQPVDGSVPGSCQPVSAHGGVGGSRPPESAAFPSGAGLLRRARSDAGMVVAWPRRLWSRRLQEALSVQSFSLFHRRCTCITVGKLALSLVPSALYTRLQRSLTFQILS